MPANRSCSAFDPSTIHPFHRASSAVVALALAVSGCGGSGGDPGASSEPAAALASRQHASAVVSSNWVAINAPADPLLQNLAIPADAPVRGMWSGVQTWPLVGLHAAVLPNGKLLTYGTTPDGNNQNGRYLDVWDPAQGFAAAAHTTTYRADQQDSFCSSATYLSDGRLMISGGNGSVTSTLYTPGNDTVAQSTANMADERWYTTMLTLADGRPVVLGGMVPYSEGMQDNPDQAVAQGLASMTPEVYENGAWRSLAGAYSRDAFGPDFLRASYPRAWVAPSGKVFGISAERMWTFDPAGNGSILINGAFKSAPSATTVPNVGATNTAVMYDIGKLLVVGGNGSFNGDNLPASKFATAVDINGAAPVLTEQPPMSNARRYGNAIALPDGRVLVTGGATYGNLYSGQPGVSSSAAETWDPATGTWTVGASAAVFRGYHSFSALLPNGSVLSLGGGTPGPVTNLNAEVFYPPQLFKTLNGAAQLAARPAMQGISGLSYANGGAMQIDMASNSAVAKLVLIGLSNGTHSFNTGQRRIPLAFTQDGIRLTTTLPGSNLAPPGYYQVIAIDAAGVPSRGTIVAVGQNVSPPPGTSTPYSPPDLSTSINAPVITVGGSANYSVPAVAGVTYSWDFGDGSAASAPSANPAVSHVFTQAGVYAVTLSATGADGAVARRTLLQAVAMAATARSPNASSAMAIEARSAPAAVNLAPSATLATSNVSAWESLAAVNNNVVPTNSADHSSGAYGNWRGAAAYGQTDWVSFSWPTAKALSAFEVYWWNDGQGIGTPTAARVEYWSGSAWLPLGDIGTALNVFNHLDVNVTTTSVRVAMSSALATGILEARVFGNDVASPRLWVANPDSDTVAVIDAASNTRVAELAVGSSPRSVAVAPDGRVWVVNKTAASISIVNPATMAVVQTVALPRASRPHGLVFAPGGGSAFVALEGTGQLLKIDAASGAQQAVLAVGPNPRHLSISADAASVFVSRFITPALPGEGTATVDTSSAGGEVVVVNAATMAVSKTITLRHSDKADTETQGSGIPNYLGAAVVSPDGRSAWVPSKQDNIKRGTLRNGQNLNFQNSVRAISSRIDLGTLAEDYARRIDHDNSSLGSAAAFHPSGAYLFVALETSRQLAIVDAVGGRELLKVDVGRAPQAVTVSADGKTVYVQNFMDRSVSALDIGPLVANGELRAPLLATTSTVGTETLAAQVLQGKQLFYDARDPRLARDSYMSCASCHSDGGHDGRVWDFSGFGEGLRNTIALKGRAGMGHGFLHWSANFDEVQDFEKQIRDFAGGTGLMSDALYNAGTRNQPLGDRKAGLSADLDALAAYLGSLGSFDNSPWRNADGTLTVAALAGKTVFANANCASCHGGAAFTISGDGTALKNIGTLKPSSGQRLGALLTGIDVPTLRDVWQTGPYLHDGSAPTLAAAVQAHAGNTIAGNDLSNLAAYLQQIGGEEAAPVVAPPPANPPSNAVGCAAENQSCTLPASTSATVWYGAGTTWVAKTNVSGAIACNNATFGDPLPGTVKQCLYLPSGTPPNAAPTVALAAPAANATYTAGTSIAIAVNAADSDGSITRVEFYDGSTLIGTDTAAPYTLSWANAAVGTHTLTARAYDNSGAATTSAAVTLTVLAALPTGALAEWTFDAGGGTTAVDSSGNGRTLALGSGVAYTASGKAGAALQFNGTKTPAGATTASRVVTTSGSFSVSGWIRFDQLPACSNQALASQDGTTVSGFSLGLVAACGSQPARLHFSMPGADATSSTTYRILGTTAPVAGQWVHVAGVRDTAANTMALYVNGALVQTLSNSTKWSANGSFAIGRAKSGGQVREPAYAAIDSVRAYGRALTRAEVTSLYQAAR